ncbi:MAG: hypothetical protein HYR84_16075 [Planctomycetes bacterium]|nr:hypothetical protein [Planctomycetota bacterium]
MRFPAFVWFLLPPLALAGCSASPLPATRRTAEIRLSVARMPQDKAPLAAPRVGATTGRRDIVEVMDWLHTIDWSQPGADLAPVGLPPPDGEIILLSKAGDTHHLHFYWDGNILDAKTNRLLRGADITQLRAFIDRHCK